MIIWITGNSGAGKTTLAKQLKTSNSIILDGNDLRSIYPTGFTKEERIEHNLRVAKLAKLFESQGFDVIVALICPYKKLRQQIKQMINCSFIYLWVKFKGKKYPYEYEKNKFYFTKKLIKKSKNEI